MPLPQAEEVLVAEFTLMHAAQTGAGETEHVMALVHAAQQEQVRQERTQVFRRNVRALRRGFVMPA